MPGPDPKVIPHLKRKAHKTTSTLDADLENARYQIAYAWELLEHDHKAPAPRRKDDQGDGSSSCGGTG